MSVMSLESPGRGSFILPPAEGSSLRDSRRSSRQPELIGTPSLPPRRTLPRRRRRPTIGRCVYLEDAADIHAIGKPSKSSSFHSPEGAGGRLRTPPAL